MFSFTSERHRLCIQNSSLLVIFLQHLKYGIPLNGGFHFFYLEVKCQSFYCSTHLSCPPSCTTFKISSWSLVLSSRTVV